MQLTPAQRRFYIDPVQDPTIRTERLLVTEERSSRRLHIDTVVTVKPKRAAIEGRLWWVTESGDYVAGAPVNASVPYFKRLIAPGGDGWFWLGQPGRPGGSGYILSTAQRSDGRRLAGTTGNVTIEVPDAVRAADWAEALFPLPSDTDSAIRAKLALAEQRWNHRRAKAEIIRQGMQRGWTDDLAELRSAGKLPDATFGAYYSGDVLIAAQNLDPTTRDSERLTTVASRLGIEAPARPAAMMALSIEAPLRTITVESNADARKIPMSDIRDALHDVLDDYSAVPGQHTIIPVLRSVA